MTINLRLTSSYESHYITSFILFYSMSSQSNISNLTNSEKDISEELIKKLNSTIIELKQKLSYYEQEKQDQVPSTESNDRSLIYDPEYLKVLVKYPATSVASIFQRHNEIIMLTTCQQPFFIEVSCLFYSSIHYVSFSICAFCDIS